MKLALTGSSSEPPQKAPSPIPEEQAPVDGVNRFCPTSESRHQTFMPLRAQVALPSRRQGLRTTGSFYGFTGSLPRIDWFFLI
jgi:hypothetical protein